MKSQVIELSGKALINEDEFHDTFSGVFGFLEGYGRNMNAWIDCMGYLREPGGGMTKLHVGPDETLTLWVRDHEVFRDGAPALWAALMECSALVNGREVERGDAPLIALAF